MRTGQDTRDLLSNILHGLVMATLLFVALGCNPIEKEEEEGDGSAAGAKTTVGGLDWHPNTWTMSLHTHTTGANYFSDRTSFGTIKGRAEADAVSGFIHIRYEVYVGGSLYSTGTGGWLSTVKSGGNFVGEFIVFNIQVQDGVNNYVKLIAIDQIGNSTSTWLTLDVDASAPEINPTIPGPLPGPNWLAANSTALTGTATDNIGIQEIRWANNTTAANGTMTGTDSWSQLGVALNVGINDIVITSEDINGNVKDFSYPVGYDPDAPTLDLLFPTSNARFITTSTGTANLSGSWSDAHSGISVISYTNAATSGSGNFVPFDNTYAFNGVPVNLGSNPITITATDNVGWVTNVNLDYIVDTTVPTITAASMVLNNGNPIASNNLVGMDIQASDADTNIVQICYRIDIPFQPLSTDPCWQDIPPTQNLNLLGYPVNVSDTETPGTYTVYVFVKDEAGHMSDLTNGGAGTAGQDMATINYQVGDRPVIEGFVAANTDVPSNPLLVTETDSVGGSVIVKWKISDTEGFGATPIKVQYSVDYTTWLDASTDIAGFTNTGACTVDHAGTTMDDGFDGCYLWNSGVPTTGPLYLRVVATDDIGQTTNITSNQWNTGNIRILAGNIDNGSFGHADTAFYNPMNSSAYASLKSLIVTENDFIYVMDQNSGIIEISPAYEMANVLVPIDTAAAPGTGDGGDIAFAKLKLPLAMTLDHNGNIIVMDNDRIRRINMNVVPRTIETLVGGGADSSDTVANALDLDMYDYYAVNYNTGNVYNLKTPLDVLPNGDIYFQGGIPSHFWAYGPYAANWRIRKYDASTGQITTLKPGGTGSEKNPDSDVYNCRMLGFGVKYDAVTSDVEEYMYASYAGGGGGGCTAYDLVVTDPTTNNSKGQGQTPTGLSYVGTYGNFHTTLTGDVYVPSKHYGRVLKYDTFLNKFVKVLGYNKYGSCPDGTAANSCQMQLHGFWVKNDGTMYFIDSGKIRYVDSGGLVQTLYGQSGAPGDGGDPLLAKMGGPTALGFWYNGGTRNIIAHDFQNKRLREWAEGGTINTIAGNGSVSTTGVGVDATTTPYYSNWSSYIRGHFQVHPTNGTIWYANVTDTVVMLNRTGSGTGTAGQWETVIGPGTSGNYMMDDAQLGKVGTDIDLYGYPGSVLGIKPSTSQILFWQEIGGYYDSTMRLFDWSDSYRMSDLAGLEGNRNTSPYTWCANGTTTSDCWLPRTLEQMPLTWDQTNGRWLAHSWHDREVYSLTEGGTKEQIAFLPIQNRGMSYDEAGDVLFYCDYLGQLHKYDVAGTTDTNFNIATTIPGMKCSERQVKYDATADTLIFGFNINGMGGVAEIVNP